LKEKSGNEKQKVRHKNATRRKETKGKGPRKGKGESLIVGGWGMVIRIRVPAGMTWAKKNGKGGKLG